ncbi:MAG TPA: hypothetical protein VFS21_05525 [Roseiflexaceae bacterium]|nr:hypothetical protein [Roseiflexaceae bacterium]
MKKQITRIVMAALIALGFMASIQPASAELMPPRPIDFVYGQTK